MPHVLDYTLAQLRGFLAAVARHEAERDARLLSLIATGTRGNEGDIERVLRLLDHGPKKA